VDEAGGVRPANLYPSAIVRGYVKRNLFRGADDAGLYQAFILKFCMRVAEREQIGMSAETNRATLKTGGDFPYPEPRLVCQVRNRARQPNSD